MDFIDIPTSYILFLPNIFPNNCNYDEQDSEMSMSEQMNSEIIDETNMSEGSDSSDSEDDFSSDSTQLNDLLNQLPSENKKNKIINYDELPKYFIDLPSWNKSTNIACWYCRLNIWNDFPWFIPLAKTKIMVLVQDEVQNTLICLKEHSNDLKTAEDNDLLISYQNHKEVKAYKSHGIFCSPSCAQSYINKIYDIKINNKSEISRLLLNVVNTILSINITNIPESDDYVNMEQYSGPTGITDIEYINRNKARYSELLQKN